MLASLWATMTQVTSAKEIPVITATIPKMEANKPCIAYAKPLYYISLVTATTCPINFDRYTAKSGKWHKVYSILIITLILFGSGFSFHGRIKTIYQTFVQTVKITDMISEVSLAISCLYTVINVLFYGEKYMKIYFQLLEQIDGHLYTTINLRRKRFIFYTYLMLTHLAVVILCFYDYWTWTNAIDITVWQYYAFRLYSYYSNLLIVIQMCTFASAIRLRFEILNERLFFVSVEWMGNLESSKAIVLRDLFISYKKNSGTLCLDGLNLKCLIQMHDLLCDVMRLVNDAFGVNAVIVVCNVIINDVIAFNLMLVYGIGTQGAQVEFWEHILALNIFWGIMFTSMAVVLARSCDSASQEAWRTATISYKLLACMSTNSCFSKERDIRAELQQLAMQVEHRRPVFDAAGFFPINNSMLYVIIGAVTSYIVIIIQFTNTPIL